MVRRHDLLDDQKSQTVAGFGGTAITHHIVGSSAQFFQCFVGNADSIILHGDLISFAGTLQMNQNMAALGIMSTGIYQQVMKSPFQKSFVANDGAGISPFWKRAVDRVAFVSIQIDKIHKSLPDDRDQIQWFRMEGLHLIFQLGSKIQIVDQIFHADTLAADDRDLISVFFGKFRAGFQLSGVAHDHRKWSADIVRHPGNPVGAGRFLFP